jgi:leucine dehydrogenase
VNSLNGKYITAEDVGTSVQDMEHIYMETPWVTGIPKDFGGSGDPSPYTAHGVLMGIKASAFEKFGTDSLKGLKVAIQGLGNVGSNLVRYLKEEGAISIVADIDPVRTKKVAETYGATPVSSDEILFTECDILAPCALGAIVNDQSITKLKTKIIAGGANNVLAEARHGDQLKELGILYAPDYVINAGGLMNVFVELEGYSHDRAFEKTKRVYDNILKVYEIAKRENIGTHTAADRLAEDRIKTIGRLKQRHPGKSSRAFTTLREIYNR